MSVNVDLDDFRTRVLVIGLEKKDIAPLEDILIDCSIQFLTPALPQFIDVRRPVASLILCGQAAKNSSLEELGQLLRFGYQSQPIYLLCPNPTQYNPLQLKGMGFTDVFLAPIDWASLRKNLLDEMAKLRPQTVKAYHPVKLIDLKPNEVLAFDAFVYLPVNKRYVLFSKANEALDAKRVNQLVQHQISTVFIETNKLHSFYHYLNERIDANAAQLEVKSVTRQKEELREKLKDFFNHFFNASVHPTPQSGLALTAQIKAVAQAHLAPSGESTWYLPLLSWAGEVSETYAHASNVGLFAGLFSTKLSIGDPEEVVLAGLLHDCGLVNVPAEILNKPVTERTTEEQKIYDRHSEYSLTLIKNRKMQLTDRTLALISQHHLGNHKNTLPESQLISVADTIDEQVSLQPGNARRSPAQVLSSLRSLYSPVLITKILELLPTETTKGK